LLNVTAKLPDVPVVVVATTTAGPAPATCSVIVTDSGVVMGALVSPFTRLPSSVTVGLERLGGLLNDACDCASDRTVAVPVAAVAVLTPITAAETANDL
jgi:hypothetical protein